jgi:hypothetical protein
MHLHMLVYECLFHFMPSTQACAAVLAIYPDTVVQQLKTLDTLYDSAGTKPAFERSDGATAYLEVHAKATAEQVKNLRALYLFNIIKSIGQMSYRSQADPSLAPVLLPYVPAAIVAPVIDQAFEQLSAKCAAQGPLAELVDLQELWGKPSSC